MGVVIGLPFPEIAHHEAGHAVMALRLGLPLHEVLVWEKQRLLRANVARGHTKLAKRMTFEVPPIKLALVYLAGPEAQAVHLHRVHGHRLRAARERTWAMNREGDIGLYIDLTIGSREPWARDMQDTQRRMRRMVGEQWPAIARLVEALKRKHRLTGREVRRVVA
jgi:hypothetical protein